MNWLQKKAFWMSLASFVDIILKGVPPLNLESSIKDGIKYIKAFGGLLQGGVPSGYTVVEYIESTGTQYIDTGIPTQDGIGFDVTFLTNSTIGTGGDYGCILGGRKASGNNDVQITTFGTPAGYIRYGTATGNNAGIVNNQKLHVSLINRVATLNDGTTYTVPSYTFTESNNIYLFGLNNNGTLAQTGLGCRIYNAKLYVNSNVVADFVPVKRNSDNVLGMYDTVSGTFFENAGTGTFTAGNEIVPTPSDPIDLVCNNGALKILDKNDWTIFTNPTSIVGQGVFISDDGKWYTADDSGAGVAIPLTIGKQYTLVIHKKTAGLGTILRYGQSPQETPTGAGIQLTDWYRGDITDGQMISFVAKQPYLVMQLAASFVEAGGIDEAVEVIESGGDNETLAIRTKNLFDADKIFGQRTQYTKESNGDWTASTSDGAGWPALYNNGFFITLNAGTYTLSSTEPDTHFSYANASSSSDISDLGGGSWYALPKTFTVTEPTNFTVKIRRTGGSWVYPCNIGKIQLEKRETATDYIDYNGSTATANNLFAVNTYKDVQEIITGTVKHKVNVYVLNGKETAWNDVVSSSSYAMSKTALGSDSNVLPSRSTDVICSHYNITTTESGTGVHIWVGGSNVNFKTKSTYATLADWKDYLAAQYAAGTPVIVVCPLATAQDEVAPVPQTMNVVAGDNTLSLIQQGLPNLEVEAIYTKAKY